MVNPNNADIAKKPLLVSIHRVRVEIFYNNKSYGLLVALNVNVNCKIRRINHVTDIISEVQKAQLSHYIKTDKLYQTILRAFTEKFLIRNKHCSYLGYEEEI